VAVEHLLGKRFLTTEVRIIQEAGSGMLPKVVSEFIKSTVATAVTFVSVVFGEDSGRHLENSGCCHVIDSHQ
jgi:hypothetical protein